MRIGAIMATMPPADVSRDDDLPIVALLPLDGTKSHGAAVVERIHAVAHVLIIGIPDDRRKTARSSLPWRSATAP